MNCSIIAGSQHHHWLLSANCVRFTRPVTNQDYFEFLSSHRKFDSGRSIGRAAVVILLVNLFVIKVRSKLRGSHWTLAERLRVQYWLTDDCLQNIIIIIVCFFPFVINDTLSDIKGEFDVMICWMQTFIWISRINIFIYSYEYCLIILS